MRVSKTLTMGVFSLLVVLPLPILAVDCNEILAKLPDHSADGSDLAGMVDKFEKECKSRPTADNPDAYNQCIIAGMRSMAVSGNYIAAEKMARLECDAGHDAISKNWMGMVMNSKRAPEEDKAVAQEAINNKEQ